MLPFLHARAGITRDDRLQALCFEGYRLFPSLPDNEITREVKNLWSPEFEDVRLTGARCHQGLMYLSRKIGVRGLPRKAVGVHVWLRVRVRSLLIVV